MTQKDNLELIGILQTFTNIATIKWNRSVEIDVGISSLLVLSTLKRNGQQKQSELANALGLTPGAITSIADKLIKKGYAERTFDDQDRRVIYLVITEEGRQILQLADRKGRQVNMELFAVLDESEFEQLLKIYRKLISQFQ